MTKGAGMNHPKLLVVEDDDGLSRQYRWAFPEHQVLLAGTRAAARTLFARERPPVAIVDLGLPPDPAGATEGLELLREILGMAPDTKVIIATGNEDLNHALEAIAIGAFDFYHKPIDTDVLRIIVDRAYHLFRL